MVSERLKSGERGQLLLVGALAIAVIIIALVPVYNAVFLADNVDSDETEAVPDSVARYELSTLETAQRIAIRTGHGEPYDSDAAVTAAFEDGFENYTRLHKETVVNSDGTYLNTSFDAAAPGTRHGSRVVQNTPREFRGPTGSDTWAVVESTDRTRLEWFVVKLDVSNLSSSQPFVVVVSNGTDSAELAIEADDTTNDVVVRLRDGVGEMDEAVTCDSAAGKVILDLHRGTSGTGDCSFNGTEVVSGPVEIQYQNGDAAYGVYELVVEDDAAVVADVDSCVGGSTVPCRSPTLWQVSVTTSIESGRTSYENTMNVSVYGGD